MQEMTTNHFIRLIENDSHTYIVLDTSAWLRIYTYSPNLRKEIIEAIEKRANLFWIPNQVKREIERNNLKSMNENPKRLKKDIDSLRDPLNKLKTDVNQAVNKMERFGFYENENLEEIFEEKINYLQNYLKNFNFTEIKENQINIHEVIDNNSAFILNEGFNYLELMEIYKEGQFRYKHKIPPGYADEEKKDEKDKKDNAPLTTKYGDLIVWKEILYHLAGRPNKANRVNVIFVTDDRKEDFWEKTNTQKIIRSRQELAEEYEQYSSGDFYLVLSEDFFEILVDSIRKINKQQKFELEFNRIIDLLFQNKTVIPDILNDKVRLELKSTYGIENKLGIIEGSMFDIKHLEMGDREFFVPSSETFNFSTSDNAAYVKGNVYGSSQCYIEYEQFDLITPRGNLKKGIIDVDYTLTLSIVFDLNNDYTDLETNLPKIEIDSFTVTDIERL